MSVQISDSIVYGRIDATHLVVYDGIDQVLNKAAQRVGMVNILEKLHEPVFPGKRFELC